MVSPQLLLGIGVAVPLIAIGAYAVWLGRRVRVLEREVQRSSQPDEDGPG